MTENATPRGEVTLMFTDIEGSTKLLERLRERYALVLEQHRDILRNAFARDKGHEVDTQGDSFFVAFGSAPNAVACAVQIQLDLAAHEWPDGVKVRVRIGIHTGEPVVAATGYIGIDVHRGARIGAAAHGGQVLASEATHQSVALAIPDGVTFQSLGIFRFKGLADPLTVFGVRAPGLDSNFPPIQTSPPEDEPPASGEPPYKGLLRFDEEDAERFFGREDLVAQVVATVVEAPFFAIVGASGSGKSSLVHAGVIPAVKAVGGARVAVMTPTADPLPHLSAALASKPTVLVVDQFEELFTLCRDETARHEFVSQLMAAIDRGVHILITLRADFYASVAEYPALREAVADHQLYIGPMDAAGLRRAIEEPARRGGWEIAPGLVDLLLRDVGSEPGALPLLSHALLETWTRRRGSRMTLKGYFESGEVRGAIARTADRLYAELSGSEQLAAREILLRLTELGEGTQDTRRRARIDELVATGGAAGPETDDVLRRLVDGRLVTVDEGTAEVAHEALIREWPLLRTWLHEDREGLRIQRQITESAAEWAALNREPSVLYRGARLVTAREWAEGHPRALTASEHAFLDASIEAEDRDERERAEQHQRALDAEHLRAEEQAAANRRLRRRAVILAGSVVVAAVLGVAAVMFAGQASEQANAAHAEADRAEQQRTTALSRQLGAQASSNLAEPDLALLLALEGRRASDTAEARAALLTGLLAEPQLETVLFRTGRMAGAVQSDDGTILAVGVEDGIELWDVANRVRLGTVPSATESPIFGLSGNGSTLAIAPAPGEEPASVAIQIWTTQPVELVGTLDSTGCGVDELKLGPSGDRLAAVCGADYAATLYSVPSHAVVNLPCGASPTFDPTGRWLATACDDGTVVLYDIASESIARRIDHQPAILALNFSMDGEALGVAYQDQDVIDATVIWETRTAQSLVTIDAEHGAGLIEFIGAGHNVAAVLGAEKRTLFDVASGEVMAEIPCTGRMASNPSASLVAVACTSTIEVRDVPTLNLRATLPIDLSASAFTLEGMRFIGDGDRLGTLRYNGFAGEGTFKIWNIAQPALIASRLIPFDREGLFSVSVSPDLRAAVAASADGQVTIWNVAQRKQVAEMAPIDSDEPLQPFGVFSADSRVLAYGVLGLPAVHMWNVADQHPLPDVPAGPGGVQNLVLSSDGSALELGSTDEIAIWDIQAQRQIASFDHPGHSPPAFSPDGKVLALTDVAGAGEFRVTLWDASTGKMIGEPFGDHDRVISNVTFSPDGRFLATGSLDQTAQLWDVATRQRIGVPLLHSTGVVNVLFSPDGNTLATAAWGEDTSVTLWNVDDGSRIGVLPDTIGFFMSFAANGQQLAAYGTDQNLLVWDIDLANWQIAACKVANRNLTELEWQRFLPDEPYHETCLPGAWPGGPSATALPSATDIR